MNIHVPDGMVEAASCPCGVVDYAGLRRTLEAALEWLAKNPIAVSDTDLSEMRRKWDSRPLQSGLAPVYEQFIADEIQRRMFRVKRIEDMSEEEIDAELRANGIDPKELAAKMLARLQEAKNAGHDTPMLNEMIRQFTEVKVKTRPNVGGPESLARVHPNTGRSSTGS